MTRDSAPGTGSSIGSRAACARSRARRIVPVIENSRLFEDDEEDGDGVPRWHRISSHAAFALQPASRSVRVAPPPGGPFMPATVNFEHYEVMTRDDGSLCELGRGAMGITYKGLDTRLRVPVALKVINAAHLHSENARLRFVREARSAARLRHRNVASVFHLGQEGDNYYYAMEFIDGETVDARVRNHGPLTAALALQIAAQVARALNAAQTHELVHRDIKPANLMLVREDDEIVVKVIDFGLAKIALGGAGEEAAQLTMSGFLGTPHFASPEQLEEREIDVRSDIYSLGVTLWFALTGKTPFTGSVVQVMSQHISREPPFEQLANVPAPVVGLLRRMLDKNPAQRPQTALALRREIERCLEQIGESAAPAPDTMPADAGGTAAASEADETQFETGAAIDARYVITEHIGGTEAGRAFRAHDSAEDRDVRLLALDSELLRDSEAIAQIGRDAAKLAALAHPNLLGVFGFVNDGQSAYLTLEWIDGFSFRDLLRARRELGLAEVLQILPQTAAGIDAALAAQTGRVNVALPELFVHFPECETSPENFLRNPVATWPAFAVKFNALAISRDRFAVTWAGGQTIAGGARDAAGPAQVVREFGTVVYEMLGGVPAALAPQRYTPLASVGEAGNEILRRAIVAPESFASASEFARIFSAPPKAVPAPPPRAAAETAAPSPSETAGGRIGIRPSLRATETAAPLPSETAIPFDAAPAPVKVPVKVSPAAPPPAPPRIALEPAPAQAPAAPAAPRIEPPKRRRVLPYAGIAALLAIAAAVQYFRTHPAPHRGASAPVPATPVKLANIPAPVPAIPPPVTPAPPPKPTRQELANKARIAAEKLEARMENRGALRTWLDLMRDYPEFTIGKVGLSDLIERLRNLPGGLQRAEFDAIRDGITEAAKLGIVPAMMLLANQLEESDPPTALEWYSAASEKGDAVAMTKAALLLSNGVGPGEDREKVVHYLTVAAEMEETTAMTALGQLYLSGAFGVVPDKKRGIELLKAAADKGSTRAQNTLGDCYHNGDGVKRDDREAFRLFSLAAAAGNREAIGNLGVLYWNGEGVPRKDPEKAVAKFKEASEKGDPASMFSYAFALYTGVGVERDEEAGKKLAATAAEKGSAKAAKWCKTNRVPFNPPK